MMSKQVTRILPLWQVGLTLVSAAALIFWLAMGAGAAPCPSSASTPALQASNESPAHHDTTPSASERATPAPHAPSIATDTTVVVARSAAQPVLTLTAHLIERGMQLPWGEPGKMSRAPNLSRDNTIRDPRINPTGKHLDRTQDLELGKLLGQLDTEYEHLWLQMCAARKAVLLRSIDAGRVESILMASPGEPSDIFAVSNQAQRALGRQKDAVGELSRKYGSLMKDWGYADMSTTEPDGICRMNLVYWTRMEEPDFFRLQDACSTMQIEHISRARAFFDGL